MPLDPRIPLMGNVYQPDFGQIAQTRAQGMNVLSQMRQRDQELAQQNQLAAYIRGGGDPMNAGIYGEPGARIAELAMKRGELKLKQDEAAAKTQDKDRERQEKIFGTSLMRAYADPSDANMDERFADMEVAGIDTSPFRAMLAEVPDVNERKAQLGNFLTTTEEGRIFMDRFKSTPKEVNLGDRVVFIETNSNRDDFGQEISNLPVSATPSAQLNAEQQRLNRASRERIEAQELTKPKSLSATEQKDQIGLRTNLNRADTALNALNEIISSNLIQQSPAGLIESGGSALQRAFDLRSKQNEALASLQVLADKVLKNVERFEGPQGVYDVRSYEKAAGDLANPLKSTSERLAAAKTLIAQMKEAKDITEQRLAVYEGAGADAGGGGAAAVDFNDLD